MRRCAEDDCHICEREPYARRLPLDIDTEL
jgi:hypothetical protein